MAGISKKKIKTKTGIKTKYTITYRDVFGKQHTSGLYDTQKEAKKDLWKFEETKFEKIKYGFIFQEFLKKVKEKNSLNTYDNYKRYYDMYLKKYDSIDYDKINSLQWQRVFDDIAKNNSPYVAIITLKFTKAAVNRFIKHDLLVKNVFNKIEIKKPPKPDINHLTINELKKILEECKNSFPQYYALLYTFIGTGAREGEIFALTKDDYINGTIRINKQFTHGKLYDHPKTASSNRSIHLFDDLVNVLNEHIKTLKPDNPLLFPNKNGNYINISNFRSRLWVKLLEICKITKRVRLHDLRGSYIDMALSNGLSIKFAQNQVGHSKSETTLNVYAKNNDDMIALANEKINSIFRKCENFVRINESKSNKKIIPFRKRQTGISF